MSEKRRNDIVDAIVTELHGTEFIALALFKDDRLVDMISRESGGNDGGFSVMVEAIVEHEMGPVELRTDSENLYKQTVTVAGILGRLVIPDELSILYRQFMPGSDHYRILCELYELEDRSKPEPKKVGLITRIINGAEQWILNTIIKIRERF